MALRKVPLSEAMNLPLGFSITDTALKTGLAGIEVSLREHGWKGGSVSSSTPASKKNKKNNPHLKQP